MTNQAPEYQFFNPQVLKDITDNDEEIMLEIINEFISSSASYISDLENALAAADLKKVNFVAHKLKGALKFLGATQQADIAQEIENVAIHNAEASAHIRAMLNSLKINLVTEEAIDYRDHYLNS